MPKNKGKRSQMEVQIRPVGRPRLTPQTKWERRTRKAEALVLAEQRAAGESPTPYQESRLLVARRALHGLYAEGFAAGFLAG